MMDRASETTPAARLQDMPDVLRPAEAAKALRLGRNTVYELVRQGRLPAVRVGRRLLIPKRGVERFLNEAA
jgi:excisionase family DNA binding protein